METIKKIKKDGGLDDLKKEFEKGKVILGVKRTIKMIKKNKISKVYLSLTVPKSIPDLQELKEIKMEYLDLDALGLGKVFGKNFSVSVAGILK